VSFSSVAVAQSVARLVRDEVSGGLLKEEDLSDALLAALDYHSRIRRCTKVVETPGTGDRLYDLPTGWLAGFSDSGFLIEYPVDDDAAFPSMLPSTYTKIYESPTGQKIRFVETQTAGRVPASGENFRVHFQIKWVVAEAANNTTLPDGDFWPICYLTASHLCLALSAQFAQNTDGWTQGDSANYRDKDDKFTRLSKEWMAKYKQSIMPATEDLKASGGWGEFEQDEFNRTPQPLFPRDESGLKNTDS
jgi:hypothetical protein